MAEADLRHVNAVGSAEPKTKHGPSLGAGTGVLPARAKVRKRARLGPFKPRRAGAGVDPAQAQWLLSSERR